jgi:fermentation-respiration switch protein FrsA (DUF1100 family)
MKGVLGPSVAAWALSLIMASNAAASAGGLSSADDTADPATATLEIRNQTQTLYLYGTRGAPPVLVSSGDGGWLHLAPHVAEVLAARGYFVVGFDVKQYLRSFTSGNSTLTAKDIPIDYRQLTEFAGRGVPHRVMLIGISEGAGLSLLAATDPAGKGAIAGVIGLGLPDINELGWRWQDSVIYLTHGVPNEPTFSTSAVANSVAPVPLAAIQSTNDDYVTLAEVEKVLQRALEPKRLWIIKAADHSFSDNLPELDARLFDAIAWATQHSTR